MHTLVRGHDISRLKFTIGHTIDMWEMNIRLSRRNSFFESWKVQCQAPTRRNEVVQWECFDGEGQVRSLNKEFKRRGSLLAPEKNSQPSIIYHMKRIFGSGITICHLPSAICHHAYNVLYC